MLKPKCIYANKDFGYSTTGHLTPCCWANVSYADSYLGDLFIDALHIDNVDSIEDILNSKPWQDFYGMLINEPERAPRLCKKYCSVDLDTDIEGKRKSIKWKDE